MDASRGADLNTENEFGNTPLIESVIRGVQPMVELLLEFGANPNWQSSRDRNTALHVAADYERSDAISALLRFGASTALENKYSETPATLMAKYNSSL
jgi:ankyrin repeat protein